LDAVERHRLTAGIMEGGYARTYKKKKERL
jgi:hypothetical protein